MAVFSLQLLGDPVLVGPAGPVTGRAAYRRRLALLSILAVARGRPVGRERILALLWPEHPADAARHTLSESLYVLRKELGEDLFVTVGADPLESLHWAIIIMVPVPLCPSPGRSRSSVTRATSS